MELSSSNTAGLEEPTSDFEWSRLAAVVSDSLTQRAANVWTSRAKAVVTARKFINGIAAVNEVRSSAFASFLKLVVWFGSPGPVAEGVKLDVIGRDFCFFEDG